MSKGFWKNLKKPIMVLAPMADVTDPAFRRIIAKYSRHGNPPAGEGGGPDVFWTEFVSADGLFLGGKEALLRDLEFSEEERPIVAQFFTAKPEMMRKASELAVELGFDGIDINMGCPDRSIEKQGAGASLIKNPKLAREIIREAKAGAGDLPVSVKTRTGYNRDEIDPPAGGWISELLKEEPAVLTLHARTRKEMSKVPARWETVKRAVEIRDEMGSETLIFGNGDVLDIFDAKQKAKETGADGVMLGRAIFGNPWLFDENKREVSIEEKLRVMVEHTKLFEELLMDPSAGGKNFAIMKKHYKAYVNGWDGAKELRMKLMETENAEQVEKIVKQYIAQN